MTQEPTTGERKKPTTSPLTSPPAPLAPGDARARRPSPWRWAIVGVVAVLVVGGFVVLTRQPDPSGDQRPIEIVKGFVAAIEARDATKMLSYVEPTVFKKEIGPEIRAYVEYIDEIQFDDSRYQLLDNDGDRAHVRWTAAMRYKLNFGSEVKSGEKAVDTTFELTKLEGTWYLRAVQLPQT
jgi:hypothetical protein